MVFDKTIEKFITINIIIIVWDYMILLDMN